jgi:hypothetical protein
VTETAIATIDDSPLVTQRDPEKVLEEAHRAAKALQMVVAGKKKPVMMNGEQYLEFEDWQTVGRFYGITADIEWTRFVEFGPAQGFEARAHAIMAATGQIVSSAEAMCLNDEPNWKSKPLFQLRSMAQTRAAAKALRNVLAWVVVLAGYRPTPAEEIQDMADKPHAGGMGGRVEVTPLIGLKVVDVTPETPKATIVIRETPSTGGSNYSANAPANDPEPLEEMDRPALEHKLTQTAIQYGFVGGKYADGHDKVDYEKFGKWLKNNGISTGYIKKLTDSEIYRAIDLLTEIYAKKVNAKMDEQEANGELDEQAEQSFAFLK